MQLNTMIFKRNRETEQNENKPIPFFFVNASSTQVFGKWFPNIKMSTFSEF